MDAATAAPTIWLFLAQLGTVVLVLALLYRPLGDYIALTYTTTRDLRAEKGFYRLIGVDSASQQSWPAYLRSVLAFSVVGVLVVYALQRLRAEPCQRHHDHHEVDQQNMNR